MRLRKRTIQTNLSENQLLFQQWLNSDERVALADTFVQIIHSDVLAPQKCIVWLFEQQTDEERAGKRTIHRNHVGFDKVTIIPSVHPSPYVREDVNLED